MIQQIELLWSLYSWLIWDILFALLIVAVFFVVSIILSRKVFPALEKRVNETKHPAFLILIRGFRRPLAALLKVAGICIALMAFFGWVKSEATPPFLAGMTTWLQPFLYRTLRISIVLAVTWGLIASSDISSLLLRNARRQLDLHMSKSVSRFLGAVFNVVVVAIAAVVILSELSYDINGLIAGLGLGGLTIALAAKDSAANFFGGLVLVTEKPFEIGDWISCSGVEGTVEDINLRSTKVRTSAGSLTVVPNATLSGAPISNWSGAMEKRRADFTLQFTYGTTHKQMREFCSAALTLLETDPDIISEGALVRFSDIGESSLDIRIIFYTSLPGFADHVRIKERVNYALLDLAEKSGISFAFPSRSVYVESLPASASLPLNSKNDKKQG